MEHQQQFSASITGNDKPGNVTTSWGCPVADMRNSLQAGDNGHILIDPVMITKNQAFNRERIPERVVHALGVGAHGTFECTDSWFSSICKADLFSSRGKKTPLFTRFSSVLSEKGGADTAREPRGFALKFYTSEGNWDLVCNNIPVFFIRDSLLFPDAIRAQKRNPKTGLKDANAFWDFMAHTPESIHALLMAFGDRGIPFSYRNMNGYGNHSFRVVSPQGETSWVKFHIRSQEGVKCVTSEAGEVLAGRDPDWLRRDLVFAIEEGKYPKWDLQVQVIPDADVQSGKVPYDIFDVTKVVPHADYPLRTVGTITLDRNVNNDFAETEQVAFAVGRLIPGIEASPDKVLQGRLFAYHDANLYRVGTNFMQLPINRPLCPVRDHTRDGLACYSNAGPVPNYFTGDPASGGPQATADQYRETAQHVQGSTARRLPVSTSSQRVSDFDQPRALWSKVMTEGERERMTSSIAAHLKNARPEIQNMALTRLFEPVDQRLASMISEKIQASMQGKAFYTSAIPPSPLLQITGLSQVEIKPRNFVVDVPSGGADTSMGKDQSNGQGLSRTGVGSEPGGVTSSGAGGPGEKGVGQPMQMSHLTSQAASAGTSTEQHPLLKGSAVSQTGVMQGVKSAVAGLTAGISQLTMQGESAGSAAGRRD